MCRRAPWLGKRLVQRKAGLREAPEAGQRALCTDAARSRRQSNATASCHENAAAKKRVADNCQRSAGLHATHAAASCARIIGSSTGFHLSRLARHAGGAPWDSPAGKPHSTPPARGRCHSANALVARSAPLAATRAACSSTAREEAWYEKPSAVPCGCKTLGGAGRRHFGCRKDQEAGNAKQKQVQTPA